MGNIEFSEDENECAHIADHSAEAIQTASVSSMGAVVVTDVYFSPVYMGQLPVDLWVTY